MNRLEIMKELKMKVDTPEVRTALNPLRGKGTRTHCSEVHFPEGCLSKSEEKLVKSAARANQFYSLQRCIYYMNKYGISYSDAFRKHLKEKG